VNAGIADYDQEVNVAVGVGLTVGVRPEEVNLPWMQSRTEAPHNLP